MWALSSVGFRAELAGADGVFVRSGSPGLSPQVNELNHVPVPVMLLPDDFKANSKIKVTNHLFNKENLPSNFKFKEYCPQVFRNLRERFGIDDMDYQVSLTRSPPYNECESRNGMLFLKSCDGNFVIKQISSEDVADMHGFLSGYHEYIVNCHGNSVLPQFLGMYRLGVDGEETYMLVMRNVFGHRLTVHTKYDLKGSLVSREASDKEKGKELPTLKDVDLLHRCQKLYIDDEQKRLFLEKLKRDVEFLANLKIMDYSLLLGIHDMQRAEQEEELEQHAVSSETENGGNISVNQFITVHSPDAAFSFHSFQKSAGSVDYEPFMDCYAIKSAEGAPQRAVYFMGLIDILTQYDAKKKAAHAAKTVKHGAGAEISTVNPEQYAKRFMDFISNVFAPSSPGGALGSSLGFHFDSGRGVQQPVAPRLLD
eukprot:gi/632981320/ref/XP_007907527.1/ PREDICTED: phosphatidylinositol 5-phosphate 4-kinase type-2 gamma [Callorhinchus milii]